MVKKKSKRTRINYAELSEKVKKELSINRKITSLELLSKEIDISIKSILTMIKRYPEISSMLDYNRDYKKKNVKEMHLEELYAAAIDILEDQPWIIFQTSLAGALHISMSKLKRLFQNELFSSELQTLMNRNRHVGEVRALKSLHSGTDLKSTILQLKLYNPKIGRLLDIGDTKDQSDPESKTSKLDRLKKMYGKENENE